MFRGEPVVRHPGALSIHPDGDTGDLPTTPVHTPVLDDSYDVPPPGSRRPPRHSPSKGSLVPKLDSEVPVQKVRLSSSNVYCVDTLYPTRTLCFEPTLTLNVTRGPTTSFPTVRGSRTGCGEDGDEDESEEEGTVTGRTETGEIPGITNGARWTD